MAGIFDQIGSAIGKTAFDVSQAGSVGEGISKVSEAITGPNAATQAAIDKEKADLAAKGMIKSGQGASKLGGGSVLMKRDIYGLDINQNPAERVLPKAMPAAPAPLTPKLNPLEGVEGQFTPTGGMRTSRG